MMRENILPADFQSNTSLVAPNHTWLDDFICIPLSLRWVIRNDLTLYRGRGGFLDKNKLTYNWDLESLTVHEKKTILCVDPQKKHSPLASLVDIHYIARWRFRREDVRCLWLACVISMLSVALLKSPLCFHGDVSITVTSLVCCVWNIFAYQMRPICLLSFPTQWLFTPHQAVMMRSLSCAQMRALGVGRSATLLGHLLPPWATSCMCQLAWRGLTHASN